MKIAVIGSGRMGGNLGTHWAQRGHQVLFSSRHPQTLGSLVHSAGNTAQAVSVTDAFTSDAEVLLLAVPFKAVAPLAERYAGTYAEKVIIDATNPYPSRDGKVASEVRMANYAASEYTAMKFSTARTAKAFNTLQAAHLKNKAFLEPLAVPFCSQDERSRVCTRALIQALGFDAVHLGDLTHSKSMDVDEKLFGKSLYKRDLLHLIHE